MNSHAFCFSFVVVVVVEIFVLNKRYQKFQHTAAHKTHTKPTLQTFNFFHLFDEQSTDPERIEQQAFIADRFVNRSQ
ncbi:hypothetical protein BpHYR1_008685 [Brachionus plicatilis]|uniref:Uncharacterized protein n=1 Tax=Brachionus plicatilis TaxID=10195 RepID=A0A3M7RHU9_BRAPC|nr:hypothetical protein BpHYR1_008685 [Brachionus plicatilis]